MAEGARKLEGSEMIQVSAAELAQEVISRTLDAGLRDSSSSGYDEVRDAILADAAALPDTDPEDEMQQLKTAARELIAERFGDSYVELIFPDVMQELKLLLMERVLGGDADGNLEKWIDATGRRKVLGVINPSSTPPGMDAE